MKKLISIVWIVVLGLLGVSVGQWQVQPQVQSQQGPVYPSKPYSFRQTPPNYDPFQFNWYTGRWDYVPVPYENSPSQEQTPAPFQLNWNSSGAAAAAPSPPTAAHANSGSIELGQKHGPTDSGLWVHPTTQPQSPPAPKVTEFQGEIIGVQAVNLIGEARPHLLLRMRSSAGTTATVDIGNRVDIPELDVSSDKNAEVSVTGKLGDIDGSPVLFADQIKLGSAKIPIGRPHRSAPSQ